MQPKGISMFRKKIKIAVVGVGNCCSSLVQGISYYNTFENLKGLINPSIGSYQITDIDIVVAFDIDRRKVGLSLNEAIFSHPNNTKIFCENLLPTNVKVKMGRILDGVSAHIIDYPITQRPELSDTKEPTKEEIVRILKENQAEILVNYLPVGSQKATEFYMDCALEAGLGVINCIPVFIASDESWARKFQEKNLPIIGDDIKSQLGATIIHRNLVDLMQTRGVEITNTYQLNVGGNSDFLNMLNRDRLESKKESKTEAVQSVLKNRMEDNEIHVGPSDYIPWLKDNKVCFLRIEGNLFGGVPMNMEIRLSVEDSPNSAGVVIDAIRYCRVALDNNEGGAIIEPSAFLMKHPPKQFRDIEVAARLLRT